MQTHPNQRTVGLLGFGTLTSKSKSAVARVQAALKLRTEPALPKGQSHLNTAVQAVAKTYAQGVAAGRAEERKRCAAIFASPHATRNVALAAELAFGTDMAAEKVLAHLRRMPSAERAGRLAQSPRVNIAQSWDAAMQKAAGPRPRADDLREQIDELRQPQQILLASSTSDVTTAMKKASGWTPDEEKRSAGAKVSADWDDSLQKARHQTSTNRS